MIWKMQRLELLVPIRGPKPHLPITIPPEGMVPTALVWNTVGMEVGSLQHPLYPKHPPHSPPSSRLPNGSHSKAPPSTPPTPPPPPTTTTTTQPDSIQCSKNS